MEQVKKMDDKEKSFLGTLHYIGTEVSAGIGFQRAYLADETFEKSTPGGIKTYTRQVARHKTTNELHASSYPDNHSTLFYFRYTNDGEYAIYSRDPAFHFGKHLCINNGDISASDSPTEISSFAFKQNGQRIQIHEKPEPEILAELVCKDGGIEFYNKEFLFSRQAGITAQVVSKGGGGPLGNIKLKVIERNVDWLSKSENS